MKNLVRKPSNFTRTSFHYNFFESGVHSYQLQNVIRGWSSSLNVAKNEYTIKKLKRKVELNAVKMDKRIYTVGLE